VKAVLIPTVCFSARKAKAVFMSTLRFRERSEWLQQRPGRRDSYQSKRGVNTIKHNLK